MSSPSDSPGGSPAFAAPGFLRLFALRTLVASTVSDLLRSLISSSSHCGFSWCSMDCLWRFQSASRERFDVQTVFSVCGALSSPFWVAVVFVTRPKNVHENM